MTRPKQRGYQRGRPQREPESAILVVTEGAKTEPEYLKALRYRLRLATAAVEVCQADGTDPARVVDCAIRMRNERRRRVKEGEGVAFDAVWAVFDSEHRLGTEELNGALIKARDNRIQTAVSAPSFEYWLVLHYEYTTRYLPTARQWEDYLKRHIPGYDKASPPMEELLSKIGQAVTHATRCKTDGEKSGAELPWTDVHLLVSAMNASAKDYCRVL